MPADITALRKVASQLVAEGKGLLASDESISTIGKRLEKAGIVNNEVAANTESFTADCTRCSVESPLHLASSSLPDRRTDDAIGKFFTWLTLGAACLGSFCTKKH